MKKKKSHRSATAADSAVEGRQKRRRRREKRRAGGGAGGRVSARCSQRAPGTAASELTAQWPARPRCAASPAASQIRPIRWKRQPHVRSMAFPVATTNFALTAGVFKESALIVFAKVRSNFLFCGRCSCTCCGPSQTGRPCCSEDGRLFSFVLAAPARTRRTALPARRTRSRLVCRRRAAPCVPRRLPHDGSRLRPPQAALGYLRRWMYEHCCRNREAHMHTATACVPSTAIAADWPIQLGLWSAYGIHPQMDGPFCPT